MSMPTSLPSWDAWDAGLVGHASVNASEALRAMAQFESPFAGQKYGFATHGDLNPIIDHCLSGQWKRTPRSSSDLGKKNACRELQGLGLRGNTLYRMERDLRKRAKYETSTLRNILQDMRRVATPGAQRHIDAKLESLPASSWQEALAPIYEALSDSMPSKSAIVPPPESVSPPVVAAIGRQPTGEGVPGWMWALVGASVAIILAKK